MALEKVKNGAKKVNGKLYQFENWLFPFLKKWLWLIIIVLAVVLSTWGKWKAIPFKSGDYNTFLVTWMNKYKELGLIKGFGTSLGDYTPAYNYFLCIFAQFVPEAGYLYVIKILDFVCEISMALGFFFIIKHLTNNKNYASVGFSVALIIPSVIINGAFWGQCDVIFTMFLIWSFYFILRGKSHWAMIFFSISFAFKFQAIFFLPFIVLLILKRRIRIWQLLYIPLVYFIIGLPAICCGRPIGDIFSVYFRQADEYKDRIALSAPSIYALFDNSHTQTIAPVTIPVFLVITMSYIFYLFHKNIKLNAENLVTVALISLLFSAFFMPYMHERYFFAADIFAVLYIFIKKRGFILALLINMASIICCCYWLFYYTGNQGASNMFPHFNVIRVGTIFNLIAIIFLLYEMIKMPKEEPLEEAKEDTCNSK